ncbi:MAG: hypothetical protein SPL58_07945 [Bacteroidaceae bacterium]|nr:hypothetical protein [Bacteroidaceae bacterium]
MLNLLDIAYPGRPYRPRIIIDHPIDTVKAPQPVTDTVEAPKNVLDTLTAPLDSLGCKEAVEDTLRSAINFFNDWGASDGSSTLLWTSLVVLAALSLCGYFVWMYRQHLLKSSAN